MSVPWERTVLRAAPVLKDILEKMAARVSQASAGHTVCQAREERLVPGVSLEPRATMDGRACRVHPEPMASPVRTVSTADLVFPDPQAATELAEHQARTAKHPGWTSSTVF